MATQTKKLSATALSEVECTWVSLVNRGANRQPIKIHKSEDGNNTMSQKSLDLAGIGAKALKSDQKSTPVVLAALVTKGEGERISGLLADVEELKVVSVKTDDENDLDMINFVEDADLNHAIAYKHDDNLVLLVGGVKMTTQKMDFWADSTSFKENIKKTSFFPNLREASYTLVDTLANIVHSDDGEMAQKAEAEIGAFGEYVKAMVDALPVKVLKSLDAIDFNKPADEEPGKGEAAKAEDDKSEAAKAEDDKSEATKAEDDKSEAAKSEDDKSEAAKSEDDKSEAAKSDDDKSEAAKSEDGKAASAKSEDDTAPAWAQALAQKVDTLVDRIESVEQTAQKAEETARKSGEEVKEARTLAEKAESALGAARKTVGGAAQVEEDLPVPDQQFDRSLDEELRDGGIELA